MVKYSSIYVKVDRDTRARLNIIAKKRHTSVNKLLRGKVFEILKANPIASREDIEAWYKHQQAK